MSFPLLRRCRAKLASLFGLDHETSQGNESFQYTAPKQPRKSSTSGETLRTEPPQPPWEPHINMSEWVFCLFSSWAETSSTSWSSCSVICHSSPDLQIVRILFLIVEFFSFLNVFFKLQICIPSPQQPFFLLHLIPSQVKSFSVSLSHVQY